MYYFQEQEEAKELFQKIAQTADGKKIIYLVVQSKSDIKKLQSKGITSRFNNLYLGGIRMKKLFISQPMNGKTDEEILRERNEAINITKAIVQEASNLIKELIEIKDEMN